MIDKKRWQLLHFYEQMGNIASELSRSISLKKKNDLKHMNASLLRLIELLDLTIEDKRNKTRLKEIYRFKKVICDWYCQINVYEIDPESLMNYSMNFALLAKRI